MSFIQVKNVPDHLHAAVRRRPAIEGMTVNVYILDLIERDLALPSRREWLNRLNARQPVDIRATNALDAVRHERDDEVSSV